VTPKILDQAREAPRHSWFRPGEPPVVLGAGKLMPVKDFPALVRVVRRVRESRPVRLVILGEGAERTRLEDLVTELGLASEAFLPGFVQNPYAYMSHAGVFVLSSISEALPTVLIEAMAIGVPVVSTDCQHGPREILEGGKYGELVPVGDEGALAAAVVRALSGGQPPVPPDAWARFTMAAALPAYIRLIEGHD
jgi:glycosyltransferase involved in cell wall biosynthesis